MLCCFSGDRNFGGHIPWKSPCSYAQKVVILSWVIFAPLHPQETLLHDTGNTALRGMGCQEIAVLILHQQMEVCTYGNNNLLFIE